MKIFKIRQLLEKKLQHLTIEMGLYSSPSSNGDRALSPFNKKMEAASQIVELDQRLSKARQIQQQIAEVEHALEKVKDGTYGICDGCAKPIAPERLEIMPQANLCLECKAKHHKTLLSSYAR